MTDYELELERVVDIIQTEKPKKVCIQLPDGLKARSGEIADFVKPRISPDVSLMFWAGSCYGACDIPTELRALHVDVLIQFGHSKALRMGQRLSDKL